jgi:LacI family transcriptional regulator
MKRVPRIFIAFDTSRGWGRGFLQGIAAFAERYGPWDCDFTLVGPLRMGDVRRINAADGLIAHVNTRGTEAILKRVKVPVVSLELGSRLHLPNVYSDPAAIGQMAANHFIERGFRNFAFCAFQGTPVAVIRGQGFVRALESKGYSCEWRALKPPNTREFWRPDHLQLVSWIKKLPKPVAIFCIGDPRAREMANACRDAGAQVPSQVGILGIDNDELLCRLCSPQLSSIDAGATTVGYEAARILQRAINGHRPPPPIAVPPVRVIVRESSDFVPADDPNVAAAVRYIRQNTGDGINVKQLMQHLPVCRRKLELAFRKFLGRTIHEEMVQARLDRATRLLVDGQLSLARIAEECGMGHPSRLNHLLKDHTGLTPQQYRKAHQTARAPGAGQENRRAKRRSNWKG